MAGIDYYGTLGVAKDATDDDIKKAYRRLAVKYHPDKNPGDTVAEEQFKKIAEAYEVISDPERRRRYDLGEFDPVAAHDTSANYYRGGAPSFHFSSPMDIFKQFFGSDDTSGFFDKGASFHSPLGGASFGPSGGFSTSFSFASATSPANANSPFASSTRGGMSTTTTTKTSTVNGKRVVTTTKRTRSPGGTVREETTTKDAPAGGGSGTVMAMGAGSPFGGGSLFSTLAF